MNNKSIIPNQIDTYFTSSVVLLSTYTNFIDLNKSFINEIKLCIDKNIADSACDFVASNSVFFTNLNYQLSALDPNFTLYWVDQYNQSIDDIKTVTNTLIKNSYYQPYSDSVGLLTNSIFSLNDTTLSLNSIKYPFEFTPIIYSKLSSDSIKISVDLSQKTTDIFRKNIANINPSIDAISISRQEAALSTFAKTLDNNFNKINLLSKYFSIIGNINSSLNYSRLSLSGVNIMVEGAQVAVDLLGKKVKTLRDQKTIKQTLGSATPVIVKNTQLIDRLFLKTKDKEIPPLIQ